MMQMFWNPDEQLRGMPGSGSDPFNMSDFSRQAFGQPSFNMTKWMGGSPTTSAGDLMSQWGQLGQAKEVSVPSLKGLGKMNYNVGDMGNVFKGIMSGNPLKGAEFGSGTLAKMAGNVIGQGASKMFGSLMGAAAANPIGAALGVVGKIGSTINKTKAAKAEKKALGKQIDSYEGAIDDAMTSRDTTKELAEEGRDLGLMRQGEKLSDQANAINEKEIRANEQTGGLVNLGEIDFSTHQADENLQELASVIEQDTTTQYEKTTAQADAQFEDFQDQANKAIAELHKKRNSLKTKWYQNVV
jgi:hypothetical protein